MKIEQLIERVAAIKDELTNVSKLIGHMNTHREAGISCRGYYVVKFPADELMPHVEKRHRDLTNELAHLTAALDAAEKTARGWIAAPVQGVKNED